MACGFLDQMLPDAAALDLACTALATDPLDMVPLAVLGMKKHLNAIARGKLDAGALRNDLARATASAAGRKPLFRGC